MPIDYKNLCDSLNVKYISQKQVEFIVYLIIDYIDKNPIVTSRGSSVNRIISSLLNENILALDFGNEITIHPCQYSNFIETSRNLINVLTPHDRVSIFKQKLKNYFNLNEDNILSNFIVNYSDLYLFDIIDKCGSRTISTNKFLYELNFSNKYIFKKIYVKSDPDFLEYTSHKLASELKIFSPHTQHIKTKFDGVVLMDNVDGIPLCNLFEYCDGKLKLLCEYNNYTDSILSSLASISAYCDLIGKSDRNPGTAHGMKDNSCNYFINRKNLKICALDFEYVCSDNIYLRSSTRKGWSEIALLPAFVGKNNLKLPQVLLEFTDKYLQNWSRLSSLIKPIGKKYLSSHLNISEKLINFSLQRTEYLPTLFYYLPDLAHYVERSELINGMLYVASLTDILNEEELRPLLFKGLISDADYSELTKKVIKFIRRNGSADFASKTYNIAEYKKRECEQAIIPCIKLLTTYFKAVI